MANLTMEVPHDLARGLEGIAAAQRKTVQQLALDQLSSLVAEPHAGSPKTLLRAMQEPPHPSSADVEELDAAILAGWLSSLGPDDRLAVCAITRGEILFGLERLVPGRRRTELEERAAKLFAVLPCEPIPSAALARYATLVSRDTDFQAVEGLALVEP